MAVNHRAFALVLLAATAACSQGAGSPALPSASNPIATDAVASNHRRVAKATLVIRVPRKKHHRRGGHPSYVSPSTASLEYEIDNGPQQTIALSTSNPACTVVGPISYLQCAIDMSLTLGKHSFNFSAIDAKQNVLSANARVTYTVTPGIVNHIPVILGGLASSFAVAPLSPYVGGSQSAGFNIYGSASKAFSIVPLDVDGNFIIGPGAPQPVVQATPANTTMNTPSPSSPNVWTFTSTFTATNPAVPSQSTLSVSATPVPDGIGAVVTASVPLNLYQPWLYVNSCTSSCTIGAYDEQGNAKTLPAGSFPNLPLSFGAMTYDAHDGFVYVTGLDTNSATAYDPLGNQQTLSGSFPNIASPYGITFNPSNNWLYVTNIGASSPSSAVTAYDEQGNQQMIAGAWANTNGPTGIAYDPLTSWLYVATSASTVTAYDGQGNQQTVSGAFTLSGGGFGIAYDNNNGWFYVTARGSTATAFDGQGSQQATAGGMTEAQGVTYDPYDGFVYVVDGAVSKVFAYDQMGNAQTLTGAFAGLSGSQSVVVIP
jgi:hypothetical protein